MCTKVVVFHIETQLRFVQEHIFMYCGAEVLSLFTPDVCWSERLSLVSSGMNQTVLIMLYVIVGAVTRSAKLNRLTIGNT